MKFLAKRQHEMVHLAIKKAEQGTSGDIVVFITHKDVPDALAAAQQVFNKRHLKKQMDDNSLLIFVAPTSQTFALIGGKAFHERVGEAWWMDMAKRMRAHFRSEYYCEGIIDVIKRAGVVLHEHFPAGKVDRTGQSDIVEQ